jgi:hypothetical protein
MNVARWFVVDIAVLNNDHSRPTAAAAAAAALSTVFCYLKTIIGSHNNCKLIVPFNDVHDAWR